MSKILPENFKKRFFSTSGVLLCLSYPLRNSQIPIFSQTISHNFINWWETEPVSPKRMLTVLMVRLNWYFNSKFRILIIRTEHRNRQKQLVLAPLNRRIFLQKLSLHGFFLGNTFSFPSLSCKEVFVLIYSWAGRI